MYQETVIKPPYHHLHRIRIALYIINLNGTTLDDMEHSWNALQYL